MEDIRFDAFARSLADAVNTRRGALHLLASGALGSLAARLVPAAGAEAAPQRANPERRRQGARRARRELQAEGKGKGNNKGKGKGKGKGKKPKPKPLPPGCRNCGTCQMCQDGACVPDPDLWLVACLDDANDPGGRCHVCDNAGACVPLSNGSGCTDGDECSWCQNGQCEPVPEKDLGPCGTRPCRLCDRGACVPAGNQSVCVDGQGEGVCCNHACLHPECEEGERYFCDSGRCECDVGLRRCSDGSCIDENACCEDEKPCDDGSCVSQAVCCPGNRMCEDGSCVLPGHCCVEEKRCDDGSCVAESACCPETQSPACDGQCGEAVCENGERVCRPRREGQQCGGVGTACCRGTCYSIGCGAGRHFDPATCRCWCDEVHECPPGQAFSHSTCSCVCNCAGRCCVSGCCKHPGPYGSTYCCQGYKATPRWPGSAGGRLADSSPRLGTTHFLHAVLERGSRSWTTDDSMTWRGRSPSASAPAGPSSGSLPGAR